ncbi:hypothetical protein ACP70R_011203 [Stipagrostis hirtigluma subsp. patula]
MANALNGIATAVPPLPRRNHAAPAATCAALAAAHHGHLSASPPPPPPPPLPPPRSSSPISAATRVFVRGSPHLGPGNGTVAAYTNAGSSPTSGTHKGTATVHPLGCRTSTTTKALV